MQSAVSSVKQHLTGYALPKPLSLALRKLPPGERREMHPNASSCVEARVRCRGPNFGRFREETPTGKWGVHGVPASRF
jgi:hypothetical protein